MSDSTEPGEPALAATMEDAISALTSRDLETAKGAAAALAAMGPLAVPRLVEVLEDGRGGERRWAAIALKKIGAPALGVPGALEALSAAVEASDARLAKAALRALRAMGGEASGVLPKILTALERPGSRHWAFRALVEIAPETALPAARLVEALEHRRSTVEVWARERLRREGAAAREAILARLEASPPERLRATLEGLLREP